MIVTCSCAGAVQYGRKIPRSRKLYPGNFLISMNIFTVTRSPHNFISCFPLFFSILVSSSVTDVPSWIPTNPGSACRGTAVPFSMMRTLFRPPIFLIEDTCEYIDMILYIRYSLSNLLKVMYFTYQGLMSIFTFIVAYASAVSLIILVIGLPISMLVTIQLGILKIRPYSGYRPFELR